MYTFHPRIQICWMETTYRIYLCADCDRVCFSLCVDGSVEWKGYLCTFSHYEVYSVPIEPRLREGVKRCSSYHRWQECVTEVRLRLLEH